MDVGLVGLDTSHGEAFANALSDHRNARLTAVWDSETIRNRTYIEEFCAEHGAIAHDKPVGMINSVDTVLILSVDWEQHLPLAMPFLEAGIPTCIDKPVAGCIDDIDAITSAAGETVLFGGSAVPYHPAFVDIPLDRPGRWLYCVGYNDPFYYGIHLADIASHFTSANWSAVESGKSDDEVEVAFEDGSRARLFLDGPETGKAFGLLDASDRIRTAIADNNADSYAEMYSQYIDDFLAIARDGTSNNTPLNGARLLLAMEAAKKHDQQITPDSEALRTINVESDEFVRDYSPYY